VGLGLEEWEWRLSTVDALAEVLERACEAARAPSPKALGVVLRMLREQYLESALTESQSDRRCIRMLAQKGRAS
jgi:hypothetical protein